MQTNIPNKNTTQQSNTQATVATPEIIAAETTSTTTSAQDQFRVIRRNGKVTTFDGAKISIAMTKAFLAVEGGNAAASNRIHEIVKNLTREVCHALTRRIPDGGTFHIEDIQDQVELALMRGGHQKISRAYVIYRNEHAKARALELEQQDETESPSSNIKVTLADGSTAPLDSKRLHTVVTKIGRASCRERVPSPV